MNTRRFKTEQNLKERLRIATQSTTDEHFFHGLFGYYSYLKYDQQLQPILKKIERERDRDKKKLVELFHLTQKELIQILKELVDHIDTYCSDSPVLSRKSKIAQNLLHPLVLQSPSSLLHLNAEILDLLDAIEQNCSKESTEFINKYQGKATVGRSKAWILKSHLSELQSVEARLKELQPIKPWFWYEQIEYAYTLYALPDEADKEYEITDQFLVGIRRQALFKAMRGERDSLGKLFNVEDYRHFLNNLHQYFIEQLQVTNRKEPTDLVKGFTPLKDSLGISSTTKWEEITIRFIDGNAVEVMNKDKKIPTDYVRMGFENLKNRKPNTSWMLLKALAENNGKLPQVTQTSDLMKFRKRISLLRKTLVTTFGIDNDPFYPYSMDRTYQLRIRLIPEGAPNSFITNEIENTPEIYGDFAGELDGYQITKTP